MLQFLVVVVDVVNCLCLRDDTDSTPIKLPRKIVSVSFWYDGAGGTVGAVGDAAKIVRALCTNAS